MFGFFRKLLTPKPTAPVASDPAAYEREKRMALSGDVKTRLRLARDPATHREILYYLAERDDDADVRRAVIENPSMPVQAVSVMVRDRDVDVRMALAERIMGMLPGLSQSQQSQLYAHAVQALGTLALDEVLKIRVALSSTLRDHAHAPPAVVSQLARDMERDVSEPVLRFCAMLSDADLVEILKSHPASWAVQAIAGRAQVSESVSDAVVDTGDIPAGVILLNNEGALIGAHTYEVITERAVDHPEFQAPLAARKSLPPVMARRLAAFADHAVRDLLMARDDFDSDTVNEIMAVFKRRLDYANDADLYGEEAPGMRAKRLAREKRLEEDTISDALAMRDRDFVYAAIGQRARTSAANVKRIFEMRAAKPIVALAWRAGLSMRFALELQKELGHVQPRDLLYPKEGVAYPLSQKDIDWQLDFLGLKK